MPIVVYHNEPPPFLQQDMVPIPKNIHMTTKLHSSVEMNRRSNFRISKYIKALC